MDASQDLTPVIQLTARRLSPISVLLMWTDPLVKEQGGVLYIVLRIEHHSNMVFEVGRTPIPYFIDNLPHAPTLVSYVVCGGREAWLGESNRISERITVPEPESKKE